METFKDKTIVITGAGSGIGRALALNFARMGSKLALNDINSEKLNETLSQIEKVNASEIYTKVFDVSDWEAMQDFSTESHNHFGHIDIMINNAGVALGSFTVEEVPKDDFKWLMGINFWGMVYGSKAFLPYLKKQKESCLVNISSILGLLSVAKQSPYCASKFAIRGFTESLRMEAAMDFPHVNILSVHPGGIKTNIAKNSKWSNGIFSKEDADAMKVEFEKSFINTADFAAEAIVRSIKKKKKRVLIGKDAKFMWRIANWFPVAYTKIIVNTSMKKYDLNLDKKKI